MLSVAWEDMSFSGEIREAVEVKGFMVLEGNGRTVAGRRTIQGRLPQQVLGLQEPLQDEPQDADRILNGALSSQGTPR